MTIAKNNFLQKILCVMFSLITMFGAVSATGVTASAATSTSYTVSTKANWWRPGAESITIKQVKEKYYSNIKRTKTKSRYTTYYIKCVPTSWSGSKPKTIEKRMTDGSVKITLARNVTYKVTITASPIPYGHHGLISHGYAYISGAHKATYW